MTEQTQPTDAEIVELLGDPRYGTIEAVRAAIAKWGTPAGAGGLRDAVIEYRTASNALLLAQMETLGGRAVPIEPSWVEPFDAALRAQAKMYAALDATTPQPTQAQAGADAVVEEVAKGLRRYGLTLVKTASGYDVLSLRDVAAHGIKGADHA